MRKVIFVIIAVLAPAFARGSSASAETNDAALRSSLQEQASKTAARLKDRSVFAVAVADAATGDLLYSYNPDSQLVPASLLKLYLTYASLRLLGAEYEFPTEIFADKAIGASQGSVGNLYVRGYGDPTMTDERLLLLAQDLRSQGISKIAKLVIDDTLLIDPPGPEGPSPYQAGASATPINFNCYKIEISPSSAGKPAFLGITAGASSLAIGEVMTRAGQTQIQISERSWQRSKPAAGDPFTSIGGNGPMISIKGTISPSAQPIIQYHSASDPTRLFASILREALLRQGIGVADGIYQGETPKGVVPITTIKSYPLLHIITDLNHYSSNFIAGQLLYALGQDEAGYFRREVALERIKRAAAEAGIAPHELQIFDGSGLDKRNRTTVRQLVKLLVKAYQDFSIAPSFIATLSRFGASGTLKKRALAGGKTALSSGAVWGKTGTLDEVSSLAGYLEGSGGRRIAYAIIINGSVGKDDSKSIENAFVRILLGPPRF